MDGAAAASTFGAFLQILLLDLLLSGDNALVIALACRRLAPEQARKAAWLGAAGAIALRLTLTLFAGALMRLPFVQLISALPLIVIALNLMVEGEEGTQAPLSPQDNMAAAAGVIIVSDAVMSIDNVVALAAVSQGNGWLLAIGLALTIPLIVFGAFGFSRLMQAFPLLVDLGAALLGWVAGGMIVGDPLVSGFVARQAPALSLALPLAGATFVLVQGRMMRAAAPHRQDAPADPAPALEQVATAQLVVPRAVATAPKEEAATEDAAPEMSSDESDRWMIIGLIGLFVIFGLFIGGAVLIGDQ
jgi:YjbE family integral membrane protein